MPNKTAKFCFASAILVTAVFWLLWLTYKSFLPWGLAKCSLTLSLHNPLLFFFSSHVIYLYNSIKNKVPEFLLGVWKTFWNKVNRLVVLVLVGLNCCSLWIKLPHLWFIRERMLAGGDRKKKEVRLHSLGCDSWVHRKTGSLKHTTSSP